MHRSASLDIGKRATRLTNLRQLVFRPVDDFGGLWVIDAVLIGSKANDRACAVSYGAMARYVAMDRAPYFRWRAIFVFSKLPEPAALRSQSRVKRASQGPGMSRRGLA